MVSIGKVSWRVLGLLKSRKEIINWLIQMYSHVYIWKDIGSSRFQGSWPFSWPLQAQVFSLFLAFSSSRFQGFWPFLGSCRLKASRFLASLVAFASSRFQGFWPSLGLWKLKVSRFLAFSWPFQAQSFKVSGLFLAFASSRFQGFWPFLGLASSRFQGF